MGMVNVQERFISAEKAQPRVRNDANRCILVFWFGNFSMLFIYKTKIKNPSSFVQWVAALLFNSLIWYSLDRVFIYMTPNIQMKTKTFSQSFSFLLIYILASLSRLGGLSLCEGCKCLIMLFCTPETSKKVIFKKGSLQSCV